MPIHSTKIGQNIFKTIIFIFIFVKKCKLMQSLLISFQIIKKIKALIENLRSFLTSF